MAKKCNLTLRIEPELKAQADELFKTLGLDLSTATGLFFPAGTNAPWVTFSGKSCRTK